MATLPSRISGSCGVLALADPVEHPRTQFERGGGSDPDLPMREEAGGDRETVGEPQVRRDAPQCQGAGYGRGGRQEGSGGQRQAAVAATPFTELRALCKPDPDDHGRLTNLAIFAID